MSVGVKNLGGQACTNCGFVPNDPSWAGCPSCGQHRKVGCTCFNCIVTHVMRAQSMRKSFASSMGRTAEKSFFQDPIPMIANGKLTPEQEAIYRRTWEKIRKACEKRNARKT